MIDLKIVVDDEKYMPTYAKDTDACMDLKVKIINKDFRYQYFDKFGDGEFNQLCADLRNKSWILPGETRVFDTGVKVSIPEDYVMLVFVRSSTGIKKGLVLANGTGVIDSGYKDEIKMALYNIGDEPVQIKDGERLCQFMIIPRPKINLIKTEDNEDFRKGDRGGGIGSTGN